MPAETHETAPLPSGLVTFMFTDIVGSTDIGEQMGGITSHERQRAYGEKINHPQAAIVRERIGIYCGVFVSDPGDGFLFAFDDAEKAVLCGLEIQRHITAARIATPLGLLQLRIGCHTGYAIPEGRKYTATAINKADRVQRAAAPGTVFLSKETHIAVSGKIRDVETKSAGRFPLKGIGEEELFRAEDAASAVAQPVTPAKPTNKPTTTSIPHNLPTLQPFFGREDELKKIAVALETDSNGWGALIDGPGGMGKTSLAVRAAYDASPDDFKKIVFVSLKTRELDDDGERDLSGFILSGIVELFGELARELRHDDILNSPENQRPRLLLDALRGTQTLLLLDNLESLPKKDRDTLFTFVKKLPAGCKAILTSRDRIGSGAEELILEKLSETAALQTLAELATHNPLLAQTSEAERLVLYRETSGKPLLLRWTAGQLGRGHCLTFTHALEFIRSCPEGNDPLEFIFGDLVENFDAAETQAICALTYFTLPARVMHVAMLGTLPQGDIDRALRKLTVRSLAVPTDELKTFTLVPMVADFLRKTKPEVVAETGDRLKKCAFALIVENGYTQNQRFPTLNAAWPTIAAALPLFLQGSYEPLKTICNALKLFLEFSGRWDERFALSAKTELRAVVENDRRNAGWLAHDAGFRHYRRGEANSVRDCANRALEYWKLEGATVKELMCGFRLLAHGYRLAGDYPKAIAGYRGALKQLTPSLLHTIDAANVLNSLAETYRLDGQGESAEKTFRQALKIAENEDDRGTVANITANLANLALDRNDSEGAATLAKEALYLAEIETRQELIAECCQRLAQALVRQGKAAEALPYARRAVEIFTRLRAPDLKFAQATLQKCEPAGGTP